MHIHSEQYSHSSLLSGFLSYSYRSLNTLPGPSASEVTTLWCYTNMLIIIIIIISMEVVCCICCAGRMLLSECSTNSCAVVHQCLQQNMMECCIPISDIASGQHPPQSAKEPPPAVHAASLDFNIWPYRSCSDSLELITGQSLRFIVFCSQYSE